MRAGEKDKNRSTVTLPFNVLVLNFFPLISYSVSVSVKFPPFKIFLTLVFRPHLFGLVTRAPDYRSRGLRFDPRHYQIFQRSSGSGTWLTQP
jgi:hypothetical protein